MYRPGASLVTSLGNLFVIIVATLPLSSWVNVSAQSCGVDNVTVEITYDHVRSEDADPPLNAPDPYLRMKMFPWTGSCQYKIQTSHKDGQGTCTNVFKTYPLRTFYTFCRMHASTYRSLDWAVKDYDRTNADELMTRGWASLPVGNSWQGSESRDFYISFKSTNPSVNCYILSRTFSPSPTINAPITVTLNIEFPTGPVDITEHVPDGFMFTSATPPQDAMIPVGDGTDENGGGFILRWDAQNPTPLPLTITYQLTGPPTHVELQAPFGNHLDSGSSRYFASLPLDEIAIGGVVTDCNGDGQDDDLQIETGLIPDCNENRIPDVCDITNGSSPDGNGDTVPDECQLATHGVGTPAPSLKSGRIRAWPNPFNPGTTIEFDVASAGPVRIDIYNAAGRYVATLVQRSYSVGRHTVNWYGVDRDGERVPTGVYHARLSTGTTSAETKMVLLK